jgi:glycosyltransferase involved in cell wall biosynthesis
VIEPEPTLSVVVPMFNEESVLPLFAQRLRPVLDGLGEPYEVVAVDDGSSDATPAVLAGLRRRWPQLRVIRLRRNSGHQSALTAGLFRARGRYVASIDADLQDPPETIVEMLRLARDRRLDVVYGVRADRSSDARFKRWTAGIYYRVIRRLVGQDVPAQAGDFRLLSRTTVEALRELPERRPVLRLVVPWLGFPSDSVRYVRAERAAGRTKYSLSKMVRLAADSVTSFSAAPLRLASYLGLAGMLLCAVLLVAAFVAYLLDSTVAGWASLYVVVLFLGAVQLFCLGLLGEYIGRIYVAVQGRPGYYVDSDSYVDSDNYVDFDSAQAPPAAEATDRSDVADPAGIDPAGIDSAGIDSADVDSGVNGGRLTRSAPGARTAS